MCPLLPLPATLTHSPIKRCPLTNWIQRYAEARKELSQWLAEGKIQRKETIIRGGLPAAEQGLADLFNGVNTGMFSILLGLFSTGLTNLATLTRFLQANCL